MRELTPLGAIETNSAWSSYRTGPSAGGKMRFTFGAGMQSGPRRARTDVHY